jgi:hypothetical protein
MTSLVLILNYLYHFPLEKCTRCQFNKSMNSKAPPSLPKGEEPTPLSFPLRGNRKGASFLLKLKDSNLLFYLPTRDFLSIFCSELSLTRWKRLQIYNCFSFISKKFLWKILRFFSVVTESEMNVSLLVFAAANIALFFFLARKKLSFFLRPFQSLKTFLNPLL